MKYQSFAPKGCKGIGIRKGCKGIGLRKGCKGIGIRKVDQKRNSFICNINGILEFQQKNPIELLMFNQKFNWKHKIYLNSTFDSTNWLCWYVFDWKERRKYNEFKFDSSLFQVCFNLFSSLLRVCFELVLSWIWVGFELDLHRIIRLHHRLIQSMP